ncbi:type VI secretion system baseplate subunit TssK [Affinibrenneria salicis]|uniref:Type VI secretion system baseplate subunit TssK n=1 Tax=Affinibrenneria salicis TaxID=2590031 RepID=A0A5J5FYL5_9GAMM|nr:type VI secretion system baseplate subunit TssK [Affinibrenneria salicis]KAA8998154.1 type VI secretion system baseplate subunit TssK [Affinibrenneria salicis]
MNKTDKVIWSEGMFLRPHHFQQAESYLEAYVRNWGKSQHSFNWGFLTLELDQSLLQQGKVALSRASGILPDGTPFDINDPHHAPAPLQIADNQTNVNVVLALPARRSGQDPVIFSESQDSLARFISFESEVDDFNAVSVGSATVQFGKLRLRLMAESELTAEWVAMGAVRVLEKRSNNEIQLDNNYIPPMLNAHASLPIASFISDLEGLLNQRSYQMSQRLQQPGRGNSSEILDFMLLALINKHIGQVSHIRNLPLIHPERLFNDWLQFATELCTYMPARAPDKALPLYKHDNLAYCFGKLMLLLRQGLSIVMEENAIQIPLIERSHGLNIATVPDATMVREFGFVLAVRADVPGDALHTHFPAQMKIAPVTRIRDLVQLQLPGIVLHSMPAAPRQIPWHAGYTYFELEKGGELWKQMETSGAFALHLAGEFPGLNMEFWAIRNQTA